MGTTASLDSRAGRTLYRFEAALRSKDMEDNVVEDCSGGMWIL